ncbi:hypothetical protein GJU39_18275 [Pedobacter petrophilus]|uniref:DUF4252 domain-containing protein n=1 Tax=Pedobacter petrophilus TaxID=1908241 RepID=A0A7K0G3M5_9SPHI|nr:hypothetical protein [Pedobacter petrophilus]MRX78030.1 hypothetical protein [Pedobacter petrophilus]
MKKLTLVFALFLISAVSLKAQTKGYLFKGLSASDASKLKEIVSALPNDSYTLELNEQSKGRVTTTKSGTSRLSLSSLNQKNVFVNKDILKSKGGSSAFLDKAIIINNGMSAFLDKAIIINNGKQLDRLTLQKLDALTKKYNKL